VIVELSICDRSAELLLRVEFRSFVVRLCEENVVLFFGKLYPKYHRKVLRFLVVIFIYLFSAIHVTQDKSSTTQLYVYWYLEYDIEYCAGSLLNRLTCVRSIFDKKEYILRARRVCLPSCFVALLFVE